MLPLNVQLMKMIPQVKYNNYFDKVDGTTGTYCYTGIMEACNGMLPLNVQLMKMIPQVKYNNYFDKVDGTTGTYCYTGIMEASGCKDEDGELIEQMIQQGSDGI